LLHSMLIQLIHQFHTIPVLWGGFNSTSTAIRSDRGSHYFGDQNISWHRHNNK